MLNTLCVRRAPVLNVPLISMFPLVCTYKTVRLVRKPRGAVTHIRPMPGLVISLLHDLHDIGKLHPVVNVVVCLLLWVVIVHGVIRLWHWLLVVTPINALVTSRVTWFVLRTVIPTRVTKLFRPESFARHAVTISACYT